MNTFSFQARCSSSTLPHSIHSSSSIIPSSIQCGRTGGLRDRLVFDLWSLNNIEIWSLIFDLFRTATLAPPPTRRTTTSAVPRRTLAHRPCHRECFWSLISVLWLILWSLIFDLSQLRPTPKHRRLLEWLHGQPLLVRYQEVILLIGRELRIEVRLRVNHDCLARYLSGERFLLTIVFYLIFWTTKFPTIRELIKIVVWTITETYSKPIQKSFIFVKVYKIYLKQYFENLISPSDTSSAIARTVLPYVQPRFDPGSRAPDTAEVSALSFARTTN